jgi:asparagine synthase (glutamine-hydrolysing)
MGSLDPVEIGELFDGPVDLEDLYSEAIECWEGCPQTNLVDKTLQFYAKLYLQDDIMVKVDRASMMHGLEVRAPFLDIEFVDFARRIPSSYKLRGGVTKYILKKALEPLLPDEILHRNKKGFGSPIGPWFKNGTLKIDQPAPALLNAAFVRRKVEAHLSGASDERAFLWNVHVLNRCLGANDPSRVPIAA